MDKKIKVLAYCDSPTCATGFGTVSRNIFEALYRTGRYDIDILGINYWGDPHNFPYRIWPVGTNQDRDPYGRRKVANMIPKMDYDILFFLQDTFILDFLPELIPYLKEHRQEPFKSIVYYPIDGTPKESWIRNVAFCDEVFTYSKFGAEASKEVYPIVGDVKTIPHGVNVNEYKVLPEDEVAEFRKRYFGAMSDKFIFMNLNRNQQRKDIPRTIQAFKEFRKQAPNSLLYLHMAKQDQGWDLIEVCKSFGLSTNTDVVFPENFGPNQGYPREIVNMLYNCVDCVVSTCLGEGWGLSWVEAMATKRPIIMPNNTAMKDNIDPSMGSLVNSGTNPSLWTVLPHDNEVLRPLVDVEDMTAKMLDIYNNYDAAKARAEKAYKWVRQTLDWQGAVGQKWIETFDATYESLTSDTPNVAVEDNAQIEAETF